MQVVVGEHLACAIQAGPADAAGVPTAARGAVEQHLGQLQVQRGRHLRGSPRRAPPRATRPPTRSTSQASSVACASTSCGHLQRPFERPAAEHLRRLHRPQLAAVERLDHDSPAVGPLDRVGDRRRGDRARQALDRPRARPARAATSSAVSSGRAASCTSTARPGSPGPAAASALRTESERTAPPSTAVTPVGAGVPGGRASTILLDPIHAAAARRRSTRTADGRPARTSAFGRAGPEALAAPGGHDQGDGHCSRDASRTRPSDRHGAGRVRERSRRYSAPATAIWLEAESASSSSR